MLAVRKLLLADDSVTIQKIVALTFADAGIEVVAVSNGTEAIEQLRENTPDVVLADVFMPGPTGYQVCEHVKQTESLKHIPVMLLVGSFEPFDEAEARRVGADDILTKPFQSIRTLMDKVGTLLGRSSGPGAPEHSSSPATEIPVAAQAHMAENQAIEKEADTKELPPPEVIQPPEEPMTTEELEISTADTLRLSQEAKERLQHLEPVRAKENVLETPMQTSFVNKSSPEPAESFGEALLDLGPLEPARFVETDDVILDIDFDAAQSFSAPVAVQTEVSEDAAVEAPSFGRAFTGSVAADSFTSESRDIAEASPVTENEFVDSSHVAPEAAAHFVDSDVVAGAADSEREAFAQPQMTSRAAGRGEASPLTLDQLSPEVIDAIARRVVEQMSEKAVQEIAWEVVPQLADLMIKRKLEERETQNR